MRDRSKINHIDGMLDGDIDRRQMDGVSLQAKREIIERECECGCGRRFEGVKTRRFYSDACRKRQARRLAKESEANG